MSDVDQVRAGTEAEEATDLARHEVDETRAELGETLGELRQRGEQAHGRVRRMLPFVLGGAAAMAGGVLATVVIIRSRRRPTTPMQRVARRVSRRREEMMDLMAERIAEHQARAERKANPLWRRTVAKALEAGAAAGAAALVRQAQVGRLRKPQRDRELTGTAVR